MSKITVTAFALLSVLFFGNYAAQPRQNTTDIHRNASENDRRKNGSVTLNVDLNGLNGKKHRSQDLPRYSSLPQRTLFSILVFNDQLRGPESGSIALVPQGRPVPCSRSRWLPLSSSSSSKNFHPARRSTLPYGIPKQV